MQYQKEDGMLLSCIGAMFLGALIVLAPYVLIGFQHRTVKRLEKKVSNLEEQVKLNEEDLTRCRNDVSDVSDYLQKLLDSYGETECQINPKYFFLISGYQCQERQHD